MLWLLAADRPRLVGEYKIFQNSPHSNRASTRHRERHLLLLPQPDPEP